MRSCLDLLKVIIIFNRYGGRERERNVFYTGTLLLIWYFTFYLVSSLNPVDIKNNIYLDPLSFQNGIKKLKTNNATQAVNTHTFVNSCSLLFVIIGSCVS